MPDVFVWGKRISSSHAKLLIDGCLVLDVFKFFCMSCFLRCHINWFSAYGAMLWLSYSSRSQDIFFICLLLAFVFRTAQDEACGHCFPVPSQKACNWFQTFISRFSADTLLMNKACLLRKHGSRTGPTRTFQAKSRRRLPKKEHCSDQLSALAFSSCDIKLDILH